MRTFDFYKKLFILNLLFCGGILFAQPANDNCSAAIEIPFATDISTCVRTAGTTIGADPNDQSTNPSTVCSGSWFRDDVWYKFNTGNVIPDGGLIVDVDFDNRVEAGIAIYPGCDTDVSNAPLNCANTPGGALMLFSNSLTPNQDFWVRVWSFGHATDFSADFTICAYGFEYGEDILWGLNGEGEFTDSLGDWSIDNVINECGWEYWPNGEDDRSGFDPAALFSPTSVTGTVVFNSDYLDNGGDPNNEGMGPCPASQAGALVSPAIDLTGNEQSNLAIVFWQSYRHNNNASTLGTFVEYSFNGGAEWLGREINTDIPSNSGSVATGRVRFNLPFSDTQGQSDIQIRFRTGLNYYFWMLDDIQLVIGECIDLVAPANNFYAIAPNFQTPVTQVQEVAFLNDVANLGACDLDDVVLTATISDDTGIIYMDTKNYGTILAGDDIQNEPFASIFNMPATVGSYTGNYSITNGEVDSNPDDNTQSFVFEVSDHTFAKERGTDTGLSDLAATNWDANELKSWGFGNHYYVPNGAGFEMTNLTIAYQGDATNDGQVYDVFLYKWVDDGDGIVQRSERELVASNAIEARAADGFRFLDITLEADDGSPSVLLEDDTHYIAWVQFADSDINLELNLGFDEEFNYGGMDLAFDSIADQANDPNLNRFGSFLILDENLDGNYTTTNRHPIIRMTICPEGVVCNISSTTDPLSEENIISMFPNPTSNEINLKLDLVQNEDYVRINIVDITGKIILTNELRNVQITTETFDISHVPNGSYLMQYISETGTRTMKFVKQ